MRRAPALAMSAVSIAIVAAAMRSSTTHAPVSAPPAGVVAPRPVAGVVAPRPVASAPSTSAKPARRSIRRRTPGRVTVNGAAVDTAYGPVQVQITLLGNEILRAHALTYPDGGGRDHEINSVAIPLLDRETLQAQDAGIDAVSGATYTSAGYKSSLQSALDARHTR